MALATLFLLFIHLRLGFCLISPPNGSGLSNRNLLVRDGQSLTNPDNEPPLSDRDSTASGTETPKSRVLSGVGPREADDRAFDWDETCSDANNRTIIFEAYKQVQMLSVEAIRSLDDLQSKLPNQIGPKVNDQNRAVIIRADPAYTQMFRAWDKTLPGVREVYSLITTEAPKRPQERAGGNNGALRFICDAGGKVLREGGASFCGDKTQALTQEPIAPSDNPAGTIEAKFRFQKASSITFCPKFFDDFVNINEIIQANPQDLNGMDCRERILLHEYTHLKWIKDLKPAKDVTGYEQAAYAATRSTGLVQNPDNYAWYAIYSYFNKHTAGKCDVWPGMPKPNPKKPVSTVPPKGT